VGIVNDAVFRHYIRERDGWTCQRCGMGFIPGSVELHAAHIFGRGKPATRHDPENAVALCWTCHPFLDQHPETKRVFFEARLGVERYEALRLRSNGTKR
jgi:5-methylcytosine-specific restriction endonuclease McrA